ncbi:MAG TPA: hypothetical protein VFQ42_11010, partial [Mycobacterium sp.]|nr:hypothetical protein [Mycobacterium sp.]
SRNAHSAHSQSGPLPSNPTHNATELPRAWHAAQLWNSRLIAHRTNRKLARNTCKQREPATTEIPSTSRVATARSSTLLPAPAINTESPTAGKSFALITHFSTFAPMGNINGSQC